MGNYSKIVTEVAPAQAKSRRGILGIPFLITMLKSRPDDLREGSYNCLL